MMTKKETLDFITQLLDAMPSDARLSARAKFGLHRWETSENMIGYAMARNGTGKIEIDINGGEADTGLEVGIKNASD